MSGMADFSAAKLTAADGTAIAAADVKDAGVNKSIYCLTLTPRLTVLNMRSLILQTGKYMEATVVITGTAAAVTVGAAEVAGAATADPLKHWMPQSLKSTNSAPPSVPFKTVWILRSPT